MSNDLCVRFFLIQFRFFTMTFEFISTKGTKKNFERVINESKAFSDKKTCLSIIIFKNSNMSMQYKRQSYPHIDRTVCRLTFYV